MFSLFHNYLPLEKGVAFHLNILEFLHPKIWLKLARWFLRIRFLISAMHFHYSVIIPPWKRAGPIICTNLNPLHPRMPCAKFWLKLTEWFWRKRWKCEKFTTTTTTTTDNWAFGSGELKIQCKFQALKGVSVVFFKYRFIQCGDIFVRQNVHQNVCQFVDSPEPNVL